MQPCRQLIDLCERENHRNNQQPQHEQPEKCKTECLKIEKDNAPEKVEGQLNQEDQQVTGSFIGCRCRIDTGSTDSHQGKQNGPDDGKDNTGR